MANLEIVLGHSGRDDNLNTNSGGYFESLCQIASCMTAGSKPIYVSRIHTQNLNIPSRVSLNGSFDDQVKQHLESKLKQHPKKVKPILKVNKGHV